jgi:hypothetical protein
MCFVLLLQATKLLKASILKVDVGDLELDEDEYAAEMAANAGLNEANPDLHDLMQQHGINREQQQPGTAGDGDVEMQDAQQQQENIPPAGGSQRQQGEGGEKQQQQGEKQAQMGTQQQARARKTTTISADKYEFVKVSIAAASAAATPAPSFGLLCHFRQSATPGRD